MVEQSKTGQTTEEIVAENLAALGLVALKPVPDKGIDFIVYHPENESRSVGVQVKGRGATQKNNRYRWFQIRTTKKQRDNTVSEGKPIFDAWKKKVDICDFFILVSKKYNECWVFPKEIIHEIVNANRRVYGNRKDNKEGYQAEMDLDIESEGIKLADKYSDYRNNYELILKDVNGQ